MVAREAGPPPRKGSGLLWGENETPDRTAQRLSGSRFGLFEDRIRGIPQIGYQIRNDQAFLISLPDETRCGLLGDLPDSLQFIFQRSNPLLRVVKRAPRNSRMCSHTLSVR